MDLRTFICGNRFINCSKAFRKKPLFVYSMERFGLVDAPKSPPVLPNNPFQPLQQTDSIPRLDFYYHGRLVPLQRIHHLMHGNRNHINTGAFILAFGQSCQRQLD